MRSGLVAALALTALVSPGCVSTPDGATLSGASSDGPQLRDPTYRAAFRRATREGAIYDGLDQRAFVAATFESGPFREQRLAATARMLGLGVEEQRALARAERSRAAQELEFLVGLYTSDPDWNDLSSPTSIWRIELEPSGGAPRRPSSIERISSPNANLRALYPYLSPFWVGYRVRFPVAAGGWATDVSSATLRLASSLGRVALTFEVGPDDVPVVEPAPEPATTAAGAGSARRPAARSANSTAR